LSLEPERNPCNIDLIPDFIPVLGYLDDLILLPLGIWIAVRLLPDNVLAECRARADESTDVGMHMRSRD